MAVPTPAERVRAHLEHLPDACRALLAAMDRRAAAGGGDVAVVVHVDAQGHVRGLSVPVTYQRRATGG